MSGKMYACDYKHCLHPGEKMTANEVIHIGRQKYHWDCALTKRGIEEIRDIYAERIDPGVSYPILIKVLNDLVFKYELDIDFIKFAVEYYADTHRKLKSPFTLLYLRNNQWMYEKWERTKAVVD